VTKLPKKNSKKIWPNIKNIIPKGISLDKIDIWFEDESRIGQKGTLTRIWAKRGERPRVVRQQQYLNSYIIGSVCPERGFSEAIISPCCNSDSMHKHLQQISKATPDGHLAVVIMDRAGWHTTSEIYDLPNVKPLFLPKASPELNPMEQVWQWIKQHCLANRTFADYQDIEDSACDAWNIFTSCKELLNTMCSPIWAKRDI